MSSPLFGGCIAWFSASVPKNAKEKWEQQGGKISTSVTTANYIFSDDAKSEDTEKLLLSLDTDSDLVIFKSSWIEAAIVASEKSNKLCTHGIEKFILLPTSVQEELALYADTERYKKYLDEDKKKFTENINELEKEMNSNAQSQCQVKSSRINGNVYVAETPASGRMSHKDSIVIKETPLPRRYNLRQPEQSDHSSQENLSQHHSPQKSRKLTETQCTKNTSEECRDEPSQESVSSTSSRRSARLAKRQDASSNKSLNTKNPKKNQQALIGGSQMSHETTKSSKPTKKQFSCGKVELKMYPKCEAQKKNAVKKAYPIRERTNKIQCREADEGGSEVDDGGSKVDEESSQDANPKRGSPAVPKKNKRKLYSTSSSSRLRNDSIVQVAAEASLSTPNTENVGANHLSPKEIHDILNQGIACKGFSSGGRQRDSGNQRVEEISLVLTSPPPTEEEVKKSRKNAMKGHKKVIEHKKKGEKRLLDFTFGSFSGFTHIDNVEMPNAQIEDFIVNKNGCRVKRCCKEIS